MKFNRLGKIGKLFLGATLVGPQVSDVSEARAREMPQFHNEGANAGITSSDVVIERRLVQENIAKNAIEEYRENLKLFESTLERVRKGREENTMRWDALIKYVPLGRNAQNVERAKFLWNRIKIHLEDLPPVPLPEELNYKDLYARAGGTINRTNNDFRDLFGDQISEDVREAALAYFIREKGW